MIRRVVAAALAAAGLLVFTAVAGAEQLGITAQPPGSALGACFGPLAAQLSDDASTPYIIPGGGGLITAWQTNTAGDTAGDDVTFVVLASAGSATNYTVVAADTEQVPDPLPFNDVATFTLPHPIAVTAGETLGIYASASNNCYFQGGEIPDADGLVAANPPTGTFPPTAGEALTITGPGSGAGFTLNLAATLVQGEDAGVTSASSPASLMLGGAAVLRSVVTNSGPGTSPITFTDDVPSGLQIVSAATGLGSCAVSGQTVTCTITGLAVGQSATVDVVVTPTSAGSYANAVSVALATAGVYDPTVSNNTASSTLVVAQPAAAAAATPTTPTAPTTPTRACIVPKLPRIPSASARKLLTELGCTVHVSTEHSSVTKGLVIGVKGKAGSFPYHQSVTLIVSSGKKPKKRKRR